MPGILKDLKLVLSHCHYSTFMCALSLLHLYYMRTATATAALPLRLHGR